MVTICLDDWANSMDAAPQSSAAAVAYRTIGPPGASA
jgi:hypothetical protein